MRSILILLAVSTAYGAGLSATPPVVNWSYTPGSHTYPAQSISLTSSTGATSYTAAAVSENGWLLVNSAYLASSSVSSGVYLTVSNAADRLDNGSYQGTVNLTDDQGNAASITVNLTVTGASPPGGLTVNPPSLAFDSAFNGPRQTQSVALAGPTAGALDIRTASGANPGWLLTAVTGGAGSFTLTVTVAPANLQPGVYRETLVVSIGTATASLAVALTVQPQSSLTVSPQSIGFDYTPGLPLANQALLVGTTNGASIAFGASSSITAGNWLSVVPGGGTAPFTLLVSANPAGLAPGFYTGIVTVTPVQGAPLIIPVSLTVRPQPVIAVSSASVSFAYRIGDAPPAPLKVQVTGGGAAPTYSAQVTSGKWLSVAPANGLAPSALTITADPSGLAPGAYTGSLVVTGTGSAQGSATVTVALEVTGATPSIAGVSNGASFQQGAIAPGEIVTLFGSNLGPRGLVPAELDPSGRVATSLNGVQVLFNDVPAPLIYVSVLQVSAVAPYELAGSQDASIRVVWNGVTSTPVTVPVASTAPGVFTDGKGSALVVNGDGKINSEDNPAARGEIVTLYVTGEGQTLPAGVSGRITAVSATPPLTPAPVLPVSVTVGGQPADFTFAGEAPGIVAGVMQVNAVVPRTLSPGKWPIVVSVGGNASQAGVAIAVK